MNQFKRGSSETELALTSLKNPISLNVFDKHVIRHCHYMYLKHLVLQKSVSSEFAVQSLTIFLHMRRQIYCPRLVLIAKIKKKTQQLWMVGPLDRSIRKITALRCY